MRILTVRQPWAWAIIHGGKDVENRVRNVAGAYRGPIAIHVAQSDADAAPESVWKSQADFYRRRAMPIRQPILSIPGYFDYGNIIGVVDLVGVHESRGEGCGTRKGTTRLGEGIPQCSEWAEAWAHHLVIATPRALPQPIPFKGALGLRRLTVDTVRQIEEQLA